MSQQAGDHILPSDGGISCSCPHPNITPVHTIIKQVLTNHCSLFTLILTNHSALIILAAQFWCNICDLEEDAMENSLDDDETEETVLHQALKTSDTLDMLIKRLVEIISCCGEHDLDLDQWSPASASVQCLSSLSSCFRSSVSQRLVSFIQQNIERGQCWRQEYTAIISIGSLIVGASQHSQKSSSTLLSYITSFLNLAPNYLHSSITFLHYAVIFVASRICDSAPEALSHTFDQFQQILLLCLHNSKDEKTVEMCCQTIGSLYNNKDIKRDNDCHYISLLQQLHQLTYSSVVNLQQSSFSAIMDMVENISDENTLGRYHCIISNHFTGLNYVI